MLLIFF